MWQWQDNPDYDLTVRIAKEGLTKGGAFGRFTGRTKKTYTWAEHIVKNWFDAHGIGYIHNYTIYVDSRAEISSRRFTPIEFDFYLPRYSVAVEVDPLFHTKQAYHQSTIRVKERDADKNAWARTHGIHLIRVNVYEQPRRFAEEIERKLGPLLRH